MLDPTTPTQRTTTTNPALIARRNELAGAIAAWQREAISELNEHLTTCQARLALDDGYTYVWDSTDVVHHDGGISLTSTSARSTWQLDTTCPGPARAIRHDAPASST